MLSSFRKVSHPVSSWKYGLIAVTALGSRCDDLGLDSFAVFSHLMGRDADTLFVVAILTVLGLSVSDTIVVFDRIRENIRTSHSKTFEEIVEAVLACLYKINYHFIDGYYRLVIPCVLWTFKHKIVCSNSHCWYVLWNLLINIPRQPTPCNG